MVSRVDASAHSSAQFLSQEPAFAYPRDADFEWASAASPFTPKSADVEESWLLQSQLASMIARSRAHARSQAIRCECAEWGWATLMATTQKIAAGLVARGVRGSDIVVVVAEPTPLCIASMLAITCVGAAYLPWDANASFARLAAMVGELRPRLLIGDLPGGAAAGLDTWTLSDLDIDSAASAPLGNGDLAFVLFAAGTAGRPKSVATTRRAAGRLIDWHRDHPRLGRAARTLQFAALTSSIAFREIFSTLICAGSLILPHAAARRDPAALLTLIEQEHIERVFLPGAVLTALAEAALVKGTALRSLRDVVVTDELRDTPALRTLLRALPRCKLHTDQAPAAVPIGLDGDAATRLVPHRDAPLLDRLCELWARLLGLARVDPGTNLFDLGAHSIMVMRAVTELRANGFSDLTPQQVYEYPRIAQFAAFLDGANGEPKIAESAARAGRQRGAFARFAPHTESPR